MTEAKEQIKNAVTPTISISYLFVQSLMLALRYGFNKPMPWWVTWFPSVVYGGVIAFVLFIAFIGLIVALIGMMSK